jgi:hypothetical protein
MAQKSYDKGKRDSSVTKENTFPQLLNFMADKNSNLKIELLEKVHNSTT